MGIGATAGAAAVGGITLSAQASSGSAAPEWSPSSSPSSPSLSSPSLVFDPDAYTEFTTSVTGTDGSTHSVRYHFWKAITYVADPVDAKYQSLIVSVPVEIDGAAVDASEAPSSPGSARSAATARGSRSSAHFRLIRVGYVTCSAYFSTRVINPQPIPVLTETHQPDG
ncbi:hypothetical protein [Streptomyces sp. IMTB 2501]|uniref:hypothetical protein n=1 Tax=Streptomyces sp. IMTB 2501 TaxID=1776340 RepID=UPI0015C14FAC|nr:hypothetical protein [Streptomyces sp. IMTB 2501]